VSSDLRSTVSRVGKYDLKAVIARTALSVVYEGWNADIAKRVAIKLIPLRQGNDEDAREALARFKRGAQAAGQLNHRNIVSVYDYGETEDSAYLVMEYIDGPSLKALFDNQHKFSPAEIADIVGSILDALQYSHDHKVVHRDMKPANIMFTSDKTVKITDFGIARLEDSEMTQAGMVIGTPAYMSPEQFLGEKIDFRTDIYSTGVLLYHLLTGERPYEGTLATIMHKVLYGALLLPSRLSTSVTPALDEVVTRAMARKREDRFGSAAEFKNELLKALNSTRPRPERLLPPLPAVTGIALPRNAILAGIAAVVIGVGALSAWLLRSGPATAPVTDVRPEPRGTAEAVPAPQPVVNTQQTAGATAPPPPSAAAVAQPSPPSGDQRDGGSSPSADATSQPPLFGAEVRPPEPDTIYPLPRPPTPPGSAGSAEPAYPAPAGTLSDKKPLTTRPANKYGGSDTPSGSAQDRRAPPPAAKVTKPFPEAANRPAPSPDRPAAKGDDGSAGGWRERIERNTGPADGAADPAAPAVYPVTSVSTLVGLVCQSVTPDRAAALGLDGAHGMVVIGVTAGSAASLAGIQTQDVIIKAAGVEVSNLSALAKLASDTPAGQDVPVEIVRHGNRRVVTLKIDQARR
jgi:serine/threonine protein kinase